MGRLVESLIAKRRVRSIISEQTGAPNLRTASDEEYDEGYSCDTCAFFEPSDDEGTTGLCGAFKISVNGDNLCDAWEEYSEEGEEEDEVMDDEDEDEMGDDDDYQDEDEEE